MKLADKVVVVTGGGNGIGRALVLDLLGRGARVAAVDLDGPGLEQTAAEADAGERLSTHVLNITDRAGVRALPEAVVAAHGQVDGLINNAGIIQPFVPLAELDFATIDRVLQVNLYGTIHMVQAFLPWLRARPEAHLCNVSSMGGFVPFPGQTMYGASKAAVKLMTEGLYAELLDTKVGVSVVMPGAVDTEITVHSGVEQRLPDAKGSALSPLAPAAAAAAMLDGIEAGRLYVFVGSDSKVMNLLSRVAPQAAARLIQSQMKGMVDLD